MANMLKRKRLKYIKLAFTNLAYQVRFHKTWPSQRTSTSDTSFALRNVADFNLISENLENIDTFSGGTDLSVSRDFPRRRPISERDLWGSCCHRHLWQLLYLHAIFGKEPECPSLVKWSLSPTPLANLIRNNQQDKKVITVIIH